MLGEVVSPNQPLHLALMLPGRSSLPAEHGGGWGELVATGGPLVGHPRATGRQLKQKGRIRSAQDPWHGSGRGVNTAGSRAVSPAAGVSYSHRP